MPDPATAIPVNKINKMISSVYWTFTIMCLAENIDNNNYVMNV